MGETNPVQTRLPLSTSPRFGRTIEQKVRVWMHKLNSCLFYAFEVRTHHRRRITIPTNHLVGIIRGFSVSIARRAKWEPEKWSRSKSVEILISRV